VAKHLNKHPNTISIITNSDLYREYEAQRKAKFREENDFTMRTNLTGVAVKVLDALDEKLTKARDQIPMPLAVDLLKSSLDRLGFAPQSGPTVQVIANQQNNNVLLPSSVTPSVLEEARIALRAAEAQRLRPIAHTGLTIEAEPGSLSTPETAEEVLGGPSATDS